MTEQLVIIGDQKAADRLIDEAIKKVSFEPVAFAIPLLWNVPDDASRPTINAVPFLKQRVSVVRTFGAKWGAD
jgi:hypothetical protein